jgi:hypothetical protein
MSWPGFGDKEAKEEFSRRLKAGYGAAILIGFPLKNNYDLLLEGGYSQRGRKLLFNDDTWENDLTCTYFDMSMWLRKSFKFHLRKNVPVQAFVNMGPEISYWLDAKGKITVEEPGYPYEVVFNEEPTSDYRYMYLNDVNRWLFGIGLGVGLKAPLKRNQNITTELRFVSGHTFFGKEDSAYLEILGFEDTFKTNLKTISFSVAYTLDIDVQRSRKGKSTLKKDHR